MRGKTFSDDIITTGVSLKVDDSCSKLTLFNQPLLKNQFLFYSKII